MTEKRDGFHSDITEMPGNVLEKRYGPKAEGFELWHAQDLAHHIRTFTQTATQIGIPVAPALSHNIYENGHIGKVDLAEYVLNIGPTLLEVIKEQTASFKKADASVHFQQYLELFKRVWDADFPISLDPPLTNFCLDWGGGLWYVDCMPPRQRLDDGLYISEWPEPPPNEDKQFIIKRYFSPLQARVIYAQSLRNLLPLEFSVSEIKMAISDVLGQKAEDAITISQEDKDRILTNPRPTDVDLLRIHASEAFIQKKLS
ncbi:hypothetical protein MUP56_02675, partial [Patescibacteria group bacterium]|nr:hypothetical protein [Patescibacteria group bacterium]